MFAPEIGFVVTSLTAVPAADDSVWVESAWTFWISSALSLACSMHVILVSPHVAVWGPGLALRGPRGSVSRAFFAMRREGNHINWAHGLSLLFFIIQPVEVLRNT